MKSLKWIMVGIICALLVSMAVSGTLGNAPEKNLSVYSYILERIEASDSNTGMNNLKVYTGGSMLWPTTAPKIVLSDTKQEWNDNASDHLYADSIANVLDQFVFVKNDGSTAAFVRVWFAFEQGSIENDIFDEVIAINKNSSIWKWDETKAQYGVDIQGNRYVVMCAVYNSALEANNVTSNPSLLQVVMKSGASSDSTKKIDGNQNGNYDILITTQAVQYVKNADAAELLNKTCGFKHPWESTTDSQDNSSNRISFSEGDIHIE